MESTPPGKKMKEIIAWLCIPSSTFSTITKNKALLRDHYACGNTKKKRHRNPSHANVHAALFQWFMAARAQPIPISGPAYLLLVDLEVELENVRLNACTQTAITDFFNRNVNLILPLVQSALISTHVYSP